MDEYRRFYADEVRIAAALHSEDVTRAFARVPRDEYLGPPPWLICSGEQAALGKMGLLGDPYIKTDDPRDLHHNVLVSIDPERHLNNGHPSSLARWIEALDLKPGDRVYHAGCGVGYYTAILAELVGSRGRVIAIDVDPGLAERSRQNLAGYPQVTVYAGDGADFDPGECDAMLINAGVTHPHRPWLERLQEGGRMVVPLTANGGENFGSGIMVRIAREASGFSAQIISFVAIYSFSTLRDPEMEALLGKALANRELFKLNSVRLNEHEPAGTCIVHSSSVCLSS